MPPGRPSIGWGDGLRSPESAAASSAADLGGKDAAQAYNRVLSDTIGGGIFLPLTDKLDETGRTPGEADEQGNATAGKSMPRSSRGRGAKAGKATPTCYGRKTGMRAGQSGMGRRIAVTGITSASTASTSGSGTSRLRPVSNARPGSDQRCAAELGMALRDSRRWAASWSERLVWLGRG